ncbi:MAG: hypothetical protein ACMUIP_18380 [bacterium]
MEKLKEELERAGKIHGHICPSLFYGVSLALKLKSLIASIASSECHIVLEGKSICIQDGVKSVFRDLAQVEIKDTGECAIGAFFNHIQYRVRLLDAVRAKINELNRTYPLPEFQKKGVAYLFTLKEDALFTTETQRQ